MNFADFDLEWTDREIKIREKRIIILLRKFYEMILGGCCCFREIVIYHICLHKLELFHNNNIISLSL